MSSSAASILLIPLLALYAMIPSASALDLPTVAAPRAALQSPTLSVVAPRAALSPGCKSSGDGLQYCASPQSYRSQDTAPHAAPLRLASEPRASEAGDAQQPNRPVTDKWALLVGVSEFPTVDLLGAHIEKDGSSTPRLILPARADSLTFSVKDAVDVRNFLVYKAGFAPSHVKVLLNSQATGEKIRYYLGSGWLKNVVRPDDLVLVYLSSHGSEPFTENNGENYILTYDFDDRDPKNTGISMQELGRLIKQSIPSDRVVIIVDSCFSGNVKTRDVAKTNDVIGAGQIAVTACSADETSVDDEFHESGLFTNYLLANLDKYKGELKKAFEETREQVIRAARLRMHEQHPTVNYSRWNGSDVVLFAKPTDPLP